MKFFLPPSRVTILKRCFIALVMSIVLSTAAIAQTIYNDYEDGSIYVKLKDHVSVIRSVNEKINLEEAAFLSVLRTKYQITGVSKPFFAAQTPGLDRTYRVNFADASRVDAILQEFANDPTVEYAEKIPLNFISYTPNDPSFGSNQWYLKKMSAEKAWDISKGDPSITVAIVDNAIDIDHPDLKDNAWVNPKEIAGNKIDDDNNGYIDDITGWDVAGADNNPRPTNMSMSHGTHCAGDAAAQADNGVGIASIGFNVSLISVKATADASSVTKIEKGYEGITYAAAAGARVISCSWGGYTASQTNQAVITAAYNKGCVILGGAGNDSKESKFYPGAYDNAICVAATDSGDKRSSFSNYGEWVDVASPGTGIYSTMPNNSYTSSSGTSMATPIAAGLCGLMISKNPALTPKQVEDCLKFSATNIDNLNGSYKGKIGTGRINAEEALKCVISTSVGDPLDDHTTRIYTYPNPTTGKVFLETSFSGSEKIDVYVMNMLGETVFAKEIANGTNAQRYELELGTLPAGAYLLQVKSGVQIHYGKLIKQ